MLDKAIPYPHGPGDRLIGRYKVVTRILLSGRNVPASIGMLLEGSLTCF